jgi:hypothetical protein
MAAANPSKRKSAAKSQAKAKKKGVSDKDSGAPRPRPGVRSKVAFPRKNAPPTEAEFGARLPLTAGKRLEVVRGFLKKQKGVTEELYYFGPKTGWAYRYLRNIQQSICSVMIHDQRLLGIVALGPATVAAVPWGELSPIAHRARKLAHGAPSLLWLDLPLDGSGAADFKLLLKAKLKTLPPLPPPPPAPSTKSNPA